MNTINFSIKNYRSIDRAKFAAAGIVLIAGRNEAGKSSVAQAVRAALLGLGAPIPGVTKKDAGLLVRDGEKAGVIEAEYDGSTLLIDVGRATVTGDRLPHSGAYAVGAASFLDDSIKQRADFLSAHVLGSGKTGVSAEDLYAAMAEIKFGDNAAAKVWEEIKTGEAGWSNCYERAKTYVTRVKGAWEEVTGERWGVRKGENWPTEPIEAPEDATPATLDADIAKLEALVREAGIASAMSELNIEDLNSQAASIPELEIRLKGLEEAATKAREIYNELKIRPAPRVLQAVYDPGLSCPSCGIVLDMVKGKLVEYSTPSEAPSESDIAKSKAALHAYQAENSDAEDAFSAASIARSECEKALVSARRAEIQVKEYRSSPPTNDSIDEIKRELEAVSAMRIAIQKRDRAAKLHGDIVKNDALAKILAPEGLRRSKLKTALKSFNKEAAELCRHADWPTVVVLDDLSITYGNRPVWAASESGRWRTNAVLQIVLARADDSLAVVFDEADILDSRGRNGLMAMLQHADITAVICMTVNKRELVPNLDAAGLGASFWIEEGVLMPVIKEKV